MGSTPKEKPLNSAHDAALMIIAKDHLISTDLSTWKRGDRSPSDPIVAHYYEGRPYNLFSSFSRVTNSQMGSV